MLSFFRKAYFLNYLAGFIFIIICWLPVFLISPDSLAPEVLKYDTILKTGFTNIRLLNLLGLFITLISALVLNHITTEYGITGKLMTTGLFFFALLSASLSSFAVINPFILINFFLFFFIRNLYRLPQFENPIPLVFNSALMLGIASLYFFKISFLVLIIWMALIIHRVSSWRNYVVSLLGLALPYLFVTTWYFWSDQLSDFLLRLEDMLAIHINISTSISTTDLIIFVVITFVIVIAVIKTMASLNQKNINLRRNLMISLYFLLVSFILALLFGHGVNSLLITIIPAAVILSNAFSEVRNPRWYNLMFSILAIFVVVNQYFKLLEL